MRIPNTASIQSKIEAAQERIETEQAKIRGYQAELETTAKESLYRAFVKSNLPIEKVIDILTPRGDRSCPSEQPKTAVQPQKPPVPVVKESNNNDDKN